MSDLFLRAANGETVERPPIWIMRQAGRYLPEYRELRRAVDFVTLCRTPELAARATLQPIDRFGLDAAILFSDILVPAQAMGFEIDFTPGPVIDPPVRSAADIDGVRVPDADEIAPFVCEAVRILRGELEGRAPLIGFAAAPFTLAAYLVQGQGSKSFDRIRRLLFAEPALAHTLIEKVAEVTARYLRAQIDAGAQAVQLFDSWAGLLGRTEYREFALRHVAKVLERLGDCGVPRIYFVLDNAHLLPDIGESGADVIGTDWRLDLAEVSTRLSDRFVLQGNLDPCVLLASRETVASRAKAVMEAGTAAPGHIFNLGHGILPDTPIDGVETLVETVRNFAGSGGIRS